MNHFKKKKCIVLISSSRKLIDKLLEDNENNTSSVVINLSKQLSNTQDCIINSNFGCYETVIITMPIQRN